MEIDWWNIIPTTLSEHGFEIFIFTIFYKRTMIAYFDIHIKSIIQLRVVSGIHQRSYQFKLRKSNLEAIVKICKFASTNRVSIGLLFALAYRKNRNDRDCHLSKLPKEILLKILAIAFS
jgi:hypothetical protein